MLYTTLSFLEEETQNKCLKVNTGDKQLNKFACIEGRTPTIVGRLLLSAAEVAGQKFYVVAAEDASGKMHVCARIM